MQTVATPVTIVPSPVERLIEELVTVAFNKLVTKVPVPCPLTQIPPQSPLLPLPDGGHPTQTHLTCLPGQSPLPEGVKAHCSVMTCTPPKP